MHSTQIFGRFSRGYSVLAVVLLAGALGVGLALVVLLTHAKPAEAAGETWYGTVDWTEKGTFTREDGTVVTQNSRVYFEAPLSATEANISLNTYVNYTYPKPADGGCYVASQTERGRGSDTDAAIEVHEYTSSTGTPYIDVWSHDYYSGVPYVGSTTYEYAGTNPDGTSCARTETIPWPSDRMYESLNFSARETVGTTSRLCAVNSDGSFTMPCHDVSDLDFGTEKIPTTVRWSLTKNVCSGYSKAWNIGKDDTLLLFNPCQVESLNSRMSVFDDITGTPPVCTFSFSNVSDSDALKMAEKVVNKLNRTCDGYKAMLRVQWAQVRWFMYNAAKWDACAVWVQDRASWRPPKIKSATRDSDGLGIAWISPGKTEYVRTATGFEAVKCPG